MKEAAKTVGVGLFGLISGWHFLNALGDLTQFVLNEDAGPAKIESALRRTAAGGITGGMAYGISLL